MPTLVASTTTPITTYTPYDTVIIRDGVSVVCTDSSAFLATGLGVQLLIDGLVAANDFNTIDIAQVSVIRIGRTGLVSSGGFNPAVSAIISYAPGGGSGQTQISNAGEVFAGIGIGITLGNDDSHLFNSGVISGGSGVLLGVAGGLRNTLVNTGEIAATYPWEPAFTGDPPTDPFGHGVYAEGDLTGIVNHGSISAQGAGRAGIKIGTATGLTDGAGSRIENHGSITAASGWGIDISGIRIGGTARIENFGTIGGAAGGILGNDGNDVVVNRGTILGNVVLGSGRDVFDGFGGTVVGRVSGGRGDDTYIIGAADIVIVEGLAGGDDTVVSPRDFALVALAQVENLHLTAAAVVGVGNALSNRITGTIADNRLVGGGGNDGLDGQEGDDDLRGGAGVDVLSGGEGDDRLRGGANRDQLTGGEDADTFEFLAPGDSGPTVSARDTITDFTPGLDRIDLSRIDANVNTAGNEAFSFIGSAAFANQAGQLRFATVGGTKVLEGDVNGTGGADFQIVLTGVNALAAADILL